MYVELWNKPKVTYNCTVSGQMFDYLLALITYNLFIIILFFHRWLRKLVWWMEKQNLHSVRTVSWVYNEPYFLGCPAGGSHTHCTRCALHTQHNESTNRTQKNLCSHFTVLICQVCCDVTKRQFVDGHFTLCEWESVCVCVCVYFLFFFVLSVWCWCYLCRWWMAEDHMKWLRALAWPTFLFSFFNHSVIVRSKCDASQLLQFCWALMCCPEMSCELWVCQWVCTFREGWIRLERGHDFDWSESGL